MENLKDIVSRSLKRLINEEKRITQTKLAKKIGRSQPLISGMMAGNSPGNEEDRRKIADVLKMSYDEFLNYGKSEKPPPCPPPERPPDKNQSLLIESLLSQVELLKKDNERLEAEVKRLKSVLGERTAPGNLHNGTVY